MKILLFLISIMSFAFVSHAQQAVSLDSKSMTAPKYADLAAIEAAIVMPTEGMMVYNIALINYMHYNGT